MSSKIYTTPSKLPEFFQFIFVIACIILFFSETTEIRFGAYTVITIAMIYGVLLLFKSKWIYKRVDKNKGEHIAPLTIVLFTLYAMSGICTGFVQALSWGEQYEAYSKRIAEERRIQDELEKKQEAERLLNEKIKFAQLLSDFSDNCNLLYSTTDSQAKAEVAKKVLSLYMENESIEKDNCFIDSIAFKHPLKGDKAQNNPTYIVSIPPNIIKSQTNGRFDIYGLSLGAVSLTGRSEQETSTEVLVDVTAVGLKPYPYQEGQQTYWIIRLLNGSVVYLNNAPTFRINP